MSYQSIPNPVPVTGTFWPNTQPVSLATNTPTLAAGSNNVGSIRINDGTNTAAVKAGVVAVAGDNPLVVTLHPSSAPTVAQPVTGTFFQATQPVSIAAMPSTPVTGTFWQATQPVSLATNTPTIAAGSAIIGKVGIDQTTPGTTNAVQVIGSLPAGTNGIGTTLGPTLTKATQGSTGYSVQDLKDSGRAIVNAATAIAGVTAVTTEALVALNVSRDGAATSSITTVPVTSGKRYRVQQILVGIISTSAAVLSARLSLRMNPSGTATATSPIIGTLAVPSGAALAQAGGWMTMDIPDGIEFSGTMQFGVSQVCSATTGTVWVSVIGYEY